MKSDKGFALIENILSLGLLGIIAAVFLGGIGTGANANRVYNEQVTAECLARSEIEYIKSFAYQYDASEYPADPALEIPNGWSIPNPTVETLHTPDDGIQKVMIIIQRNGLEELSTIIYKVDR
jgi:type II secretory pathway pseudopilin PulG